MSGDAEGKIVLSAFGTFCVGVLDLNGIKGETVTLDSKEQRHWGKECECDWSIFVF